MILRRSTGLSILLMSIVSLAAALLLGAAGCTRARAPVMPPPKAVAPTPPPPVSYETRDHGLLEQALQGRPLSPQQALILSDRLLTEGSPNFHNEETMARLELLLLKAVQGSDRISRAELLRNLGIVHYHQKQYKRARQELQASNELNPRDGRTHFYLARLFSHQELIYQRMGQGKKARGQAKLAKMEIGLARKLEPHNSLYQQDLQEILRQEQAR